jgi:hypothetical protein
MADNLLAESGEGEEDANFVDEADEIQSIVSNVVASEGANAETHYDRWKAIVRLCMDFPTPMPVTLIRCLAAQQVPRAVTASRCIPRGNRGPFIHLDAGPCLV